MNVSSQSVCVLPYSILQENSVHYRGLLELFLLSLGCFSSVAIESKLTKTCVLLSFFLVRNIASAFVKSFHRKWFTK